MAQTMPVTDEPAWDQIVLLSNDAGGRKEYEFYKVPSGTADSYDSSVVKTIQDTNLDQASKLGGDVTMQVEAITLSLPLGTSIADIQAVFSDAVLLFGTDASVYDLRIPIRYVPNGCGLTIGGGPASATTAPATVGAPHPSSVLRLTRPVTIGKDRPIIAKLQFRSVPVLTANKKLMIVLWGSRFTVPVIVNGAGEVALAGSCPAG